MGNPWMAHVRVVSKANKGKSLKDILQLAKKTYTKIGKTVSKVIRKTIKRRKRGKSVKSKRGKSVKSKRRGRKSRGRKRS